MRAALDSEAERNGGDGFESSERWLRQGCFVWAALSRHKLVRNRPPSSLIQTRTSAALGFREGRRRTACRSNAKGLLLSEVMLLQNQTLLCIALPYPETEIIR